MSALQRAAQVVGQPTRMHRMPFGAEVVGESTRFRLWAPSAQRVELLVGRDGARDEHALERGDGGWCEVTVPVRAGAHYAFRIDGSLVVPDPASRSNPEGVHAASAVVDPCAYAWQDGAWRGRPWEEAVVYELHVGTFTPEGTFRSIETRLDQLVDLGVTAIELMPIAAFPGRRNWGYDGVLQFAPDANYGTPEDLKRLVDFAHARELMLLLDVVYNHFGPDGNYLHAYASAFFNARHRTPWGASINLDGEGSRDVRAFFVHNALYWLEEFRFDGLRIDAVHALADAGEPHFLDELAAAVRELGAASGRHVHLILENDRNEATRLARTRPQCPRSATAQWNDDFHHALHVLVTGERDGYYADYADRPLTRFGRALAEGFVQQGEPSAFRGGIARGEPSASLPPVAFVDFAQNHDQVGNRALGERITRIADPARLRTALACMLLAPAIPMLFMGEEFAARTPFLYFCDFAGELAHAVTRGRREEFAKFAQFADSGARSAIPDPNDEATFLASKLDWADRDREEGAATLAFYRECLAARREHVVPLLASIDAGGMAQAVGNMLRVQWPLRDGRLLVLQASFGGEIASDAARGEMLFESDTVRLTLGA